VPIEVEGLRFTYPGRAGETLRGIDFSVRAGEVFGFLGPSGAGKSTTQKILTGVLGGYRGRVRVLGAEIREHGPGLYERVGVGFELPNVYSRLTGLENLRFFASLYDGETVPPEELLASVGLEEAGGERVAEYSKGMKMRLNFCRALLNRPELLLLDEPTSGLDPGHAREMKRIIRERARGGVTVFLTTHDMGVAAEICDRVAFMVDGRIPLIDTPRALMVRQGSRTVRVEYREGGGLARREFPLDGIGDDAAFLSLLRERPIETIHTLDATLEEVFIAVTGQRLR
jgi:fluoroquinolone transport system ATP-binding protein